MLCPLNVGKHHRKKIKEVLLLFISCINPLSLQCYHHSYKMITNPAICLKKPRLVINPLGLLDLREEKLGSKEALTQCQPPPWVH